MHHYQVVLTQMRSGKSDRQIAALGLMGRGKCGELRALAAAHGWLVGALPEPQVLHALLSPPATLSVASAVESYRDRVTAWVAEGIAATTIFGALKRDELALRKSPVALQLMRSIKTALDPQGLFNPGRML